MSRTILSSVMLGCSVASAAWVGGCATSPPSEAGRNALTQEARGTLAAFEAADPSLRGMLDRAPGYAVFPDVGKAGFIAGGAYGRGEVYENRRLVGYADLSQGTLGLQIGAQTYDELIIFFSQEQLNRFKSNQFVFSANVSAVAIKPGVAAAADHSKGTAVFIHPRGGLMAEASIGGQQFTFNSIGQAEAMDATTSGDSDRHASGEGGR